MDAISHQVRPFLPDSKPFQHLFLKIHPSPLNFHASSSKTQQNPQTDSPNNQPKTHDDGIPTNYVKTLAKFKSRYNYIRVLEVSRRADHPFAGSRLLLLDNPGNIHSISFLLKYLTNTYFDVFASLPPIIPCGPLGILGFGAGSAARLIYHLYPDLEIHGWELDPLVISVGREYFGLLKLEKQNPGKLFVYVGDALKADVRDGFSGILVDLFCRGSLISELQDWRTWEKLKRRLRKGGRIMVNCGGDCVEAEDPRRSGNLVKDETLKAMEKVFPDELLTLELRNSKEDSCLALTGGLPDLDAWMQALPIPLRCYVDMWTPYHG